MNQHRLACFEAAFYKETGAWLNCIPCPSTDTMLDNNSLRIGVALRIGLFAQHRCRCGATVDPHGLHPLSCRFSAGRIPRHAALNDVVCRALRSAGLPSELEPAGLDRGDGRRPDGMTVLPFARGRCLLWDATCVDIFRPTTLPRAAITPGVIAEEAEVRKRVKYGALTDRYDFQPIAVETSGVLGPSTRHFLRTLGSKISVSKGEPRETSWLYGRISMAVLRGNIASILASTKCLS